MFLLDTLDNLPRLRISNSLMKVFLWILQEGGANDVPSFGHLHKVQKKLRSQCGVPTIPCKSVQGNVFHINDPRSIIAKVCGTAIICCDWLSNAWTHPCHQDWSNPLVRKHIHFYPEITDGPISEVWHAEKWRYGMDLDAMSPMWDAGSRHYYVNELCQCQNGNFIIPVRWLAKTHKNGTKTYHADAFAVTIDENVHLTILSLPCKHC